MVTENCTESCEKCGMRELNGMSSGRKSGKDGEFGCKETAMKYGNERVVKNNDSESGSSESGNGQSGSSESGNGQSGSSESGNGQSGTGGSETDKSKCEKLKFAAVTGDDCNEKSVTNNVELFTSKETAENSDSFGNRKIGTTNVGSGDEASARKEYGTSPITVSCDEETNFTCPLKKTLQDNNADTSSTGKLLENSQPSFIPKDKRQKVFSMMKEFQQRTLSEAIENDPDGLMEEYLEGDDQPNICRICHGFGDEVLVTPCRCTGSAQHVHASCLLAWFKKSVKNTCELCQQRVEIDKKMKALSKWRLSREKPFPIIWFFIFILGILLNAFSLIFNATAGCHTTTCVAFYIINGLGVLLDLAFLVFWWGPCLVYCKKWWALNQEWTLTRDHHVNWVLIENNREEGQETQYV